MDDSVEKLMAEALSLPADARARLANRLPDSLAPPRAEGFRDLWMAEGLRRLDEVHSGKAETIPAEAALARAHRAILG
jgi:putative addiction module component (TIGR02574 family)